MATDPLFRRRPLAPDGAGPLLIALAILLPRLLAHILQVMP